MRFACAARHLCGMPQVPLSSPPNHRCMFCGTGMHGALCGRLYSEDIASDQSFIDPSREGLAASSSALMCTLCINTHLCQVTSTESPVAAAAVADAAITDAAAADPTTVDDASVTDPTEITGSRNDNFAPPTIYPPMEAAAPTGNVLRQPSTSTSNQPSKRKDENLYCHFNIIKKPNGRFSASCKYCPDYDKPDIQGFNSTRGRKHLLSCT
eukprot:6376096-Ditylum_brightwellii.AAC.1